MNKKRKLGYYWIILEPNAKWTIGFNDGTEFRPWTLLANDESWNDEDIFKVGRKISYPREKTIDVDVTTIETDKGTITILGIEPGDIHF